MSYTDPEPVVLHPLLQQDIEIMCSAGENPAHNWALGLFFGGVGLIQNVLNVAISLGKGTVPTAVDSILALACVGCLSAGIAKYTEYTRTRVTIINVRRRLEQRTQRPINRT